jgi:hypothetical protein
MNSPGRTRELTLRQAAVVAGVGYVLTLPTAVAEHYVIPKLVVADAAQTAANILLHTKLFNLALLCLMINFVGDLLATWGLYYLLKPAHAAWSLLVAWFRLVYTAVGIVAVLDLVTARRLATAASYQTLFGPEQLHAQVKLALDLHDYHFGFSLFLFGLHLVLLGWLMFKSGYVPKVLGILIMLIGALWVATRLRGWFLPSVDLGFVNQFGWGELALMLWLLIWGSRLKEPVG